MLSTHDLVKYALAEDIGKGDITSDLTISSTQISQFQITAKEDLILCGKEFVIESFKQISEQTKLDFNFNDGDQVKKSDVILSGKGNTKNILSAERVALNFLQYFSGIATITNKYVKLVKPYGCEILDTRKTLPLYRNLVKYAVLMGGGSNHRMRLDDQILIKDNHIKASEGIKNALKKCSQSNLIIEIECENLEQVSQAISESPDIIMLDNMNISTMKEAIRIINKKAKIEVSGNVSLENIIEIAKLGIDYISIGKITHSVQAVDISLKIIS